MPLLLENTWDTAALSVIVEIVEVGDVIETTVIETTRVVTDMTETETTTTVIAIVTTLVETAGTRAGVIDEAHPVVATVVVTPLNTGAVAAIVAAHPEEGALHLAVIMTREEDRQISSGRAIVQ